jgi:hypothetical protein
MILAATVPPLFQHHHDVCWLDIPVDQIPFVNRAQSSSQLRRDSQVEDRRNIWVTDARRCTASRIKRSRADSSPRYRVMKLLPAIKLLRIDHDQQFG